MSQCQNIAKFIQTRVAQTDSAGPKNAIVSCKNDIISECLQSGKLISLLWNNVIISTIDQYLKCVASAVDFWKIGEEDLAMMVEQTIFQTIKIVKPFLFQLKNIFTKLRDLLKELLAAK